MNENNMHKQSVNMINLYIFFIFILLNIRIYIFLLYLPLSLNSTKAFHIFICVIRFIPHKEQQIVLQNELPLYFPYPCLGQFFFSLLLFAILFYKSISLISPMMTIKYSFFRHNFSFPLG